MSLGIVFKGPEGIVLAADSRVTLNAPFAPPGQPPMLLPASFDNATKLLRVNEQKYVGAVTFGLGAIGQVEPRTAHSFIPEFEAKLAKEKSSRLSVEEFAKKMSSFFEERWKEHGMPEAKDWKADPMIFFVGGYDEGQPYGRVFQFDIPRNPKPSEVLGDKGNFGAVWGGQRMFVDRLIQGFDDNLAALLTARLSLTAEQQKELVDFLKPQSKFEYPIPSCPCRIAWT